MHTCPSLVGGLGESTRNNVNVNNSSYLTSHSFQINGVFQGSNIYFWTNQQGESYISLIHCYLLIIIHRNIVIDKNMWKLVFWIIVNSLNGLGYSSTTRKTWILSLSYSVICNISSIFTLGHHHNINALMVNWGFWYIITF